MSTLTDCIFKRDLQSIEQLITLKEVTANEIDNNRSALALAAACNYIEVAELLTKLGADINLNNTGDLGYTPLIEACRETQLEMVRFLVLHGADIEKPDTRNGTPLLHACISASKDIVEFLISTGAEINAKDVDGQTPLHYLCRFAKGWGSAVITETINGVTTIKENPRFLQHTEIFNILIRKGADATLFTNYGFTPLHLAAQSNAVTFIKPLILNGANVNAINSKGYSPLHAACDEGHTEAALELLQNGATINSTDNDGFTPLLSAVLCQNATLVSSLLLYNPDKNIPAKIKYQKIEPGDTPLSLAKKLTNQVIIDLLQK